MLVVVDIIRGCRALAVWWTPICRHVILVQMGVKVHVLERGGTVDHG